jgi:hypothetical protein
MGAACSTHGWVCEMHSQLYSNNLMGRGRLREVGVDGRIILKWNLNMIRVFGLDSSGL